MMIASGVRIDPLGHLLADRALEPLGPELVRQLRLLPEALPYHLEV
jgi:hypothetical protein